MSCSNFRKCAFSAPRKQPHWKHGIALHPRMYFPSSLNQNWQEFSYCHHANHAAKSLMLATVETVTRNKCIASSNKRHTSSNKKLLETSASLVVTSETVLVGQRRRSPRRCPVYGVETHQAVGDSMRGVDVCGSAYGPSCSNKCHASSNRCLTGSNKTLLI